MTSFDRAIPEGSTVLVTGANGFLGSHIIDQFLKFGYKVRASVRNPSKETWATDLFDKDRFEMVAVPDMTIDHALDEAAKASPVGMDPDPNTTVTESVTFAMNGLKAAYATPTVKRFVLCSSSAAAAGLISGNATVTETSWNEAAAKEAWNKEPKYPEIHAMIVYEASKKASEEEVWKYYKEHQSERPDLVVNAVLPNFILGRSVDPATHGFRSSGGLTPALWNGAVIPFHNLVAAQYFIDVEDAALLHVAGAILPHVKGQRIFGYAHHFNWDIVLDILRSVDPNRKLPENFSGGRLDREIEPRGKAEQLLKDLGRPGWKSLEDSVKENIIGAGA